MNECEATQAEQLDPPKWVHERVSTALGLFDLAAWRYDVLWLRGGEMEEHAGPNTAAYTDVNGTYHDAKFAFAADMEDDIDGREHIIHEVIHCALYRIEQAIDQSMLFVPEKQRRLMQSVWSDAREESVTRLARAINPLVNWAEQSEEPEPKS